MEDEHPVFALSWPPRQCILSLIVDANSANFGRKMSVLTCMTEALVEKRGSVEGYLEEVYLSDTCISWRATRGGCFTGGGPLGKMTCRRMDV